MQSLPYDIIGIICKDLSIKDLSTLAKTCHHWNQALQSKKLEWVWHGKYLANWDWRIINKNHKQKFFANLLEKHRINVNVIHICRINPCPECNKNWERKFARIQPAKAHMDNWEVVIPTWWDYG